MYRVGNVYVFSFENSGRSHILLSSYVCSSSTVSIRFHQPWAVLFWYVASEFSGLQFPNVLFIYTKEVTTQGDIFEDRGLFGLCVNGRFILHLYSTLEFGEPYNAMGFILNEPYRGDFIRGKVLLWPSVEWPCRCTRRAYKALENIVSYWTFHNRS